MCNEHGKVLIQIRGRVRDAEGSLTEWADLAPSSKFINERFFKIMGINAGISKCLPEWAYDIPLHLGVGLGILCDDL